MPEDEKEQVTENLLEEIMKENSPKVAKEIYFQEVQEAQRASQRFSEKLDPRKHTPRHIIIPSPKIKDK